MAVLLYFDSYTLKCKCKFWPKFFCVVLVILRDFASKRRLTFTFYSVNVKLKQHSHSILKVYHLKKLIDIGIFLCLLYIWKKTFSLLWLDSSKLVTARDICQNDVENLTLLNNIIFLLRYDFRHHFDIIPISFWCSEESSQ